jgi:[NiFe] hydrogenase assembly HybE family chaperone
MNPQAVEQAVEVARRVVEVFEHIANTRMHDFPLGNPALRVQAVGFCDWQGWTVGVLIAPWSINLLRVPQAVSAQGSLDWALPSGDYRFMPLAEPCLPGAQICSLYSPPAEFGGQAEAEAVAQAIMNELLRAPRQPEPARWSRRALLRGSAGA